ncbi:hypothetical protein MMC18_000422 [Xylographa bjoerkii]|nr:hypothetical protein [Xylographa bjoerkii]
MRYTLLAGVALLAPLFVSAASIGNHDKRDGGSVLEGRLDRVVRSADGAQYVSTDIPTSLARRQNAVRRAQSAAIVEKRRSLQPRDASPKSAANSESYSEFTARRRNAAKRAVLRSNLSRRHQMKRDLRPRAAQHSDLFERDILSNIDSVVARRRLVSRIPKDKKPKESKEQKEIDGAKKTLTDDLASEKKAQDKAAANAVKGVDKSESKAEKDAAKEEKKEQKSEAKADKGLEKAQANAAKEEKDKGKSGKAGKAYNKAENDLKKAEGGVDKTKANGANAIKNVDSKEDKDISKTGQKLDKAETKAHTDQFGATGARLAKSHPTAWQKFKSVMAKIGEGIEWAITGLSLLVPGAEEAGLARLAAKGAEMIAEKATKEGVKKAAEKGIKKGAKEEGKKLLNGQNSNSAVDAAKTESDAQVAAGKANAQKGQDQFSAAAAAAKAKQPGGKRDVGLDARILHARYSHWGAQW